MIPRNCKFTHIISHHRFDAVTHGEQITIFEQITIIIPDMDRNDTNFNIIVMAKFNSVKLNNNYYRTKVCICCGNLSLFIYSRPYHVTSSKLHAYSSQMYTSSLLSLSLSFLLRLRSVGNIKNFQNIHRSSFKSTSYVHNSS